MGKYFYKFYYYTKVINEKEEPQLKKSNANFLTKLLIDFIEKERYIAEKLTIRFIKNNKKDIDYSKYYDVEKKKWKNLLYVFSKFIMSMCVTRYSIF